MHGGDKRVLALAPRSTFGQTGKSRHQQMRKSVCTGCFLVNHRSGDFREYPVHRFDGRVHAPHASMRRRLLHCNQSTAPVRTGAISLFCRSELRIIVVSVRLPLRVRRVCRFRDD